MENRNIRSLARVFFGRLFENDVFSSSVAASSSVIWLVLATLGRSQTHRFIIGSYAGLALLLAFPLSSLLARLRSRRAHPRATARSRRRPSAAKADTLGTLGTDRE